MEPSPYLTFIKYSPPSKKKSAMLLVAKNLLPLKQQEDKEGSNWNDLLLQTASHLL